MKNLILIFALLFVSTTFGQEAKGVQKVKIQTSAQCGECKTRIEEKLNYTKGVKYAKLDLETMIVEVGYSSKKISLEQIKKTISEIGYDADEVKATKSAYDVLPACCKVGGHSK